MARPGTWGSTYKVVWPEATGSCSMDPFELAGQTPKDPTLCMWAGTSNLAFYVSPFATCFQLRKRGRMGIKFRWGCVRILPHSRHVVTDVFKDAHGLSHLLRSFKSHLQQNPSLGNQKSLFVCPCLCERNHQHVLHNANMRLGITSEKPWIRKHRPKRWQFVSHITRVGAWCADHILGDPRKPWQNYSRKRNRCD